MIFCLVFFSIQKLRITTDREKNNEGIEKDSAVKQF